MLLLNADVDSTRIRGSIPVTVMVEPPPGPGRAEAERMLRGLPGLMFFAADERGIRDAHLAASVADLEPLRPACWPCPGCAG